MILQVRYYKNLKKFLMTIDYTYKEEDELFYMLGKDYLKSTENMLPFSRKEVVKMGKSWFKSNNEKIKKVICQDDVFLTLVDQNDRILLLTAISDLISGIVLNVSPFTLANIILKMGIKNYCEKAVINTK